MNDENYKVELCPSLKYLASLLTDVVGLAKIQNIFGHYAVKCIPNLVQKSHPLRMLK
jgi:hypothetical protein